MKKIMFNDRYGLTAAVLQDRKTMTRRIVPTQYVPMIEDGLQGAALIEAQRHGDAYREGEIVAVAQNYKDVINTGYDLIEKRSLREKLENELGLITLEYAKGWSNKMFVRADLMPHQIQITDINIERLQDITDEDCIKEGIYVNPNPPKWREYDPYEPWPPYVKPYKFTTIKGFCKPQFAFAYLIDAVSSKGTWERNPFVFAYSFKLIK